MRYATDHGFFELNPFPGCNQIVVSNHSWVEPMYRGCGIGSTEHDSRLTLINDLGYDYALCTVKDDNIAQIKILEKADWDLLATFTNRETGNVVRIYGRHMNV